METIEREPCPRCGEPAALVARVCPHCQGSVLVDVFVAQAIPDARQRYQVARMLVGLGLPGVSLTGVQSALGLPGTMPVARGLSRAAARSLVSALDGAGVKASERGAREAVAPVAAARSAPTVPRRSPVIGGLGVVIILMGVTAWQQVPWKGVLPGVRRAVTTTPPSPTVPDAAAALTTRQIAERATPSTVSLRCRDSVGAGFFVADDLILSNAHVSCSGERFIQAVLSGGRQLVAEVVKRDTDLDLAVFRILGANTTPLPLGDATSLGPGDKVVIIGSPRGLEFTVHEGIVSNAGRNYLGVAYLQIDANVNPGNSGGPLLDGQGRVVGVVSMMIGRSSGLGLVLPVNYAYEGTAAMLKPPASRPAAEKWTELLAKVGQEDHREAQEINRAFERDPGGLVGLTSSSHDVPTAVVARRFMASEPRDTYGTFVVFQGGHRRCGRTYTIQNWRPVRDEGSRGDSRFYRWMERNGITRELYVGFAQLQWIRSDCSGVDWRAAAELRLEHAVAPVDSLMLNPSAPSE